MLADTSRTPAWDALQALLASNPPLDATLVGPVTAANREAATLDQAAQASGDTATQLVMQTRERHLAYLLAAIQGTGTASDIQGIIQQLLKDNTGPFGLDLSSLKTGLMLAALVAGAVLLLPALARGHGTRSY